MDDFHSVKQWGGNGFGRVGRRNEHDLRQIERNVQVVVDEIAVLLRVQDFQKRGSRVTVHAGTLTPRKTNTSRKMLKKNIFKDFFFLR